MKHLNRALAEIFGDAEFYAEKCLIIEAVDKDNNELVQAVKERTNKDEPNSKMVAQILPIFNEVFEKKSRMITKKVENKYKEILRTYSMKEIKEAMIKASNDDYHKETGYKYCTLEYFSRADQMDKWFSYQPNKKTGFTMPKMNLKK